MQTQSTRSPADGPGVYFILAPEAGRVKIGLITSGGTIDRRLANLRGGSPVPLELHRFIATSWPSRLERALHRRFAAARLHGEWFAASILAEADRQTDDELWEGA